MLVLEDLHWADDSTLALINHLSKRHSDMPLLMIGTYREGELDLSPSLSRTLEGSHPRQTCDSVKDQRTSIRRSRTNAARPERTVSTCDRGRRDSCRDRWKPILRRGIVPASRRRESTLR